MYAAQAAGKQATPWRLLALLMAMTGLGPATLNILVPALPGLVTRLASDTGTVQLMLSLYLISLATAQLLFGPLSDRFGRRPVVLAGLALNASASIAAMTTSSIGALIATRVVQAIGASAGIVIGRSIIRDLFERDRAAAMIGLVTTAMVIAPMISPLVGDMSGNFTASRLSQRAGIDAMIIAGIVLELIGSSMTAVLVATLPEAGPAIIFLPQLVISYGNGLLLPNAIAGAVSVRPQAAGTASGMTGFTQMATGAASTQVVMMLLSGAATAMPMAGQMLLVVVATGAAYFGLVRR